MKRSISNIKENYFLDDPLILIRNSNYLKFIPQYSTSREEQLNAIVRFCLYYIILNILLGNEERTLYLPIVVVIMCSVIYYIDEYDYYANVKKFTKQMKNRVINNEMFSETTKLFNKGNNFITSDKNLDINDDTDDNENNVEAGFYDSNGKLIMGKKYNIDKSNNNENLYSADEIENFRKNTCKRPSHNNPFMNPIVEDFNNGPQPEACNADDEDIHDEVAKNFNKDLYRNVEDLWDKKNSQRNFYTLPATGIPNNQVEFAKWLYANPDTCKENNKNCLRYEDLRFKR